MMKFCFLLINYEYRIFLIQCVYDSDSLKINHNHFTSLCLIQLAAEYSECPSGKKGGDLGWFPRGKMAGPFQDVAFSTPVGATSAPFKSTWVSILMVSFVILVKCVLMSISSVPNSTHTYL